MEGLERIPGIGPVIGRAVRDLVLTGRLPMLDRLRGEAGRSSVLASVPGVGPVLAERVHEELGIETLEDLETAAHDGRLSTVAGFGSKRIQGIRDALAARLGQWRRRTAPLRGESPPVAELLSVDAEYREKAERGTLRTIAPRRFNPRHESWLPVLHTRRGDRHYTALYSNTARAHQLGRTHDWVVLYYDGSDGERSSTVVTAQRGPLDGERVVRGREHECELHYAGAEAEAGAPAAR
jgi:DNA polymerase (family 10)